MFDATDNNCVAWLDMPTFLLGLPLVTLGLVVILAGLHLFFCDRVVLLVDGRDSADMGFFGAILGS